MEELKVNNVTELKKQLESLISKYIKELNSTVSTHIEIYDSSEENNTAIDPEVKKFVEDNINIKEELNQQSINHINRLLSKEFINKYQETNSIVSGDGLLNYFNYINNENSKHLCFIRFSGFEGNAVTVFKNTPLYSFIKFFMDNVFEDLNGNKYNRLMVQNIRDYLSSKGREFMREVLKCISSDEKARGENDLFDEFNYISTLNYEGVSVSAKLLLINEEEMSKHINFYIRLEQPINFNQHRRIRKLLETSDKKTFLIGDHENIYGLGTLQNYEEIKEKPIFVIDFIGKLEYRINNILISREILKGHKIADTEDVRWHLHEQSILYIRYGTPNLRENKFSSTKLRDEIQKVFGIERDEKNLESMVKMVGCAARQRSGTTVVITKPNLAEEEIEELEYQAIRIKKTNLFNKNSVELEKIIDRITCIDGAIYLDLEGNCYAIGVILDGIAEKNQGDSSRGARYNSAIRYANKEKVKDNCIIVVVSEDGMIDIIPNSEKNEEEINQLINQVIDLVNKKEFTKALELTKEKASMDNMLAHVYLMEGYIYEKMNKREQSMEMYNKAIEQDDGLDTAYNNRGYIYISWKKYDEALKEFTKAIELNQNNAVFYYNRALMYGALKEYEKAIIDYTKAIELNQNDIDFYIGRADAYNDIQDYIKVLDDYERALSLEPNNLRVHKACGDVYRNSGNYKKAKEKYQIVIDLDQDSTEAKDAQRSLSELVDPKNENEL